MSTIPHLSAITVAIGSTRGPAPAPFNHADPDSVRLNFTGEYSLAGSLALAARAAFTPAMRLGVDGTAWLDLVFPVEGSWDTVGVSIVQTSEAVVARVEANPGSLPVETIQVQLEHLLALDVEGEGFLRLGRHDAVIAALQAERPGVRPVLFASPYEAAARAIIGHRLFVNQAAAVQARISDAYGVSVSIGGRTVSGFPSPDRLSELSPVPGLADQKVQQLRALGAAASEGWLDTARLQAMTHDDGMQHLQKLGGIGPFSAELILLRGVGDPDAFPLTEMRLHRAMAKAYGLGDEPAIRTLKDIADSWSPYRSWVGLLLRNQA